MTAIFTGLGSGFERSSANILGGAGQIGGGTLGRAGEGVSVNAATGNLLVTQQDEFLSGRGLDISISRTYNSLAELSDGDNGDQWQHSTYRRVFGLTGSQNANGSTIKRQGADGSSITYTWNSSKGAYVTTDGDGAYDTLKKVGSYWEWKDGSSQIRERYYAYGSDNWRITQQRDNDNYRLNFAYSGSKLDKVTTANGEWTQYHWSGNNIARITTGHSGGTLTRTYYGYDSANRLTSVTTDLSPENNSISDGKTYVTNYTYHGSTNRIATITQTDGSSLAIQYNGAGKVTSLTQTVAGGDTRVTTVAYGSNYTTITHADGTTNNLYYDSQKRLTQINYVGAQSGDPVTFVQFTYDANGNVTSVRDQEGQVTNYTYDGNGNTTKITDPNGNTIKSWYDANNNLTRTRTYGSNNSSANAAQYTRYAYDGENHLRYTISAEGHVTEYRYTGTGLLQYEIEYPEHVYNTSSAIPTLAQMDAWRNGLGDRSSTKITLHSYDARGNKTRVWNYGYATATGGASNAEGYSRTYFTYDQAGQLLSTYDGSQVAETFVYDGLGRITASTDLAGGTTSFVFQDAATKTIITTASGGVTTNTFNKAGELISQTTSGRYDVTGTSSYLYDKNGRLRVETDETGYKTYYLYDKQGRKIADINHYGHISEYRYNDAGRIAASVSYTYSVTTANRNILANPNNTLEISNIRPAAHSYDIWEWNIYDATGRVIQTIDGEGRVARFEYDKSDRLIKTTSYYNQLTSSQLTSFRANAPEALVLPTAHAKDSISRTFYNRDGQVIGALDGEGYLSENVYDEAGQLVQSVAYAQKTSASYWASGSFNQLRGTAAPTSAANRRSHNVYDGQGQLRYSVNAQGAVSSFTYNIAGKLTKTVEHAATISTSDYTYDNVKAKVAAIANASNDRTSTIVYNSRGQVSYSTDAAGLRTTFTYDNRGQVIKTVVGTGSTARTTRNYYTGQGDLRFTVDAEGYVKRFDYDKEGRLTREVTWSNKVTASDSTTIAQINSLANAAGTWTGVRYTYDAAGRRNSVYDGEGNRTVWSWRANGTLANEWQAYGTADKERTIFYYDDAGRKVREINAYGTSEVTNTYWYYDGLGNLTRVRDPENNNTYFTHDEVGRVLTETDAAGGVTTYEYNAFGEVVKVTDPRGNASYNYYDNQGRLTKTRDAENYVTETSYTIYGEVASVTRRYNRTTSAVSTVTPPTVAGHAKDATTTFEYDKRGLVTRSTDAEGHFETYTYDAYGNRITARAKSSTTSTVAGGTTSYVYDKRNLLISETLPIKSYNNSGAVLASTVVNTYSYDARGNRIEMVEASNVSADARTTQYVYDKANRLVETIGQTFLGQTPREFIYYDARGNITETKDAGGGRTLFFYDDLNRKVVEINAVGTYTKYTYDKNGNVTEARVYENAVSLPASGGALAEAPAAPAGGSRVTNFTYDNLNRLLTSSVTGATTGYWNGSTWVASTAALTTSYQYDANGNVVKLTDPNGNTTWSYYDKSGRKTAQVDGERYRTDWSYDSEGNVMRERRYVNQAANPTSTTSPPSVSAHGTLDRITDFTYDEVGNRLTERRLNVLRHNGSGAHVNSHATISYLYNGLGQVTRKTEASGEQVNYKYDAGGRLTEEKRSSFTSHQNTTVTPEVDYYYNGVGDLTRTVAAGAGDAAARVTRYTYDGDKLRSMIDAEGNTRLYWYDAAGRQTYDYYQRRNSSGAVVNTYEGTLTSYDLLGRATQQYQATYNGSWVDSGPRAVTTYNAYGEVASVAVGGRTQTQNKYDAAGRLWATNSGDGVWKYFGYDKNGNQTIAITSAGVSLSGLNFNQALSNIGSLNVNGTYTQYDKRNLATSVVEEGRQLGGAVQNLTTNRTYNAFGEVLSETNANGARIDYTYNNMGRLIKSENPTVQITNENGSVANVRPTEHYYYDVSGRLVASRDANGNLTRLTLLAGTGYGGTEALVTRQTNADGGIKQTKFDIHGDARTMIDEINRTTTQKFDKMGRVIEVNHAGGLTEFMDYDILGQQIKKWNNFLVVGAHYNPYTGINNPGTPEVATTDYDVQGRVISQRDFGGDVTTNSYTWNANLATSGLGTFGGWTQVTTYANGRTLTENADLFGRTLYKNDLGGHVTNFTYDAAGRLTQSAIGGSTTSYEYHNSGQIGKILTVTTTVVPSGYGTTTTVSTLEASYGYDKVGNRLSEYGKTTNSSTYSLTGTVTTTVNIWKNATATYDALGRLKTWVEAGSAISPASSIANHYDANGNIRRTTATYRTLDALGNASTTSTGKDYYFRYDNMNRLVTDRGQLVGGQIVRGNGSATVDGGKDILYNKAGERVAVLTTEYTPGVYNPYTGFLPGTYREARESYSYDLAGRLTQISVSQGTAVADNGSGQPSGTIPSAPTSGTRRSTFQYDLLGRQTVQMDYEANGTTVSFSRSAAYNVKNQLTSDTTNVKQGSDVNRSVTSYNYGTGASYALGNVVYQTSINYKNNNSGQAPNTRTDNTYQYFDGAVQATIRHDNNTGSGSNPVYQTTFTYDQRGSLTRAYMGDYYAQHVTFTNDENGQIIRRDESAVSTHAGSPHEVWYRYNGRQLGYTGNNGTADVSTNESIRQRQITPPTTHGTFRNGAQVGSSYADFAQSYDPLNSYNQGSNTSLYNVQAGDTLQGIAAQVYGDASLWYKIAQANGLSGSSALTQGQRLNLPAGVVKNTHNAGTFQPYNPAENIGDLTPTANAPPKKNKCGVFGQILLAVVAVAVTVVTAGTLGPVGAAVAGSVVSQGVGVATGIQDKFSFKSVALAAITAGVTQGLGDIGVFSKLGIAGESFGSTVARGALSNAVTQGIGVATGLQSKFSFAGVAAAGVGAGVGAFVGDKLGAVDFSDKGGLSAANIAANGVVGAASAIANAATRSAIEGSSFGDNIRRAIPDIIGQAIGGAIGGAGRRAIDRVDSQVDPVSEGKATAGDLTEAIVVSADGQPIVAVAKKPKQLNVNDPKPLALITERNKHNVGEALLELGALDDGLMKVLGNAKREDFAKVIDQREQPFTSANDANLRNLQEAKRALAKAELNENLSQKQLNKLKENVKTASRSFAESDAILEKFQNARSTFLAGIRIERQIIDNYLVGTSVDLHFGRKVEQFTKKNGKIGTREVDDIRSVKLEKFGHQFDDLNLAAQNGLALSFSLNRLLGDNFERGGQISKVVVNGKDRFTINDLQVGTFLGSGDGQTILFNDVGKKATFHTHPLQGGFSKLQGGFSKSFSGADKKAFLKGPPSLTHFVAGGDGSFRSASPASPASLGEKIKIKTISKKRFVPFKQ